MWGEGYVVWVGGVQETETGRYGMEVGKCGSGKL